MGRCPRSRLTVSWTLSPNAWLRQQPSPHLQFPPAPAVSGEQGFGRPLLASSSGAEPTTVRVCSSQQPGRPLSQGVLPGEQAEATTSRPWTHWGTTASQVEAEETVACSPANTGLGFWAVEGRAVCAHGWTGKDSLWLEQGVCFRKEGRWPNLEYQLQTLDVMLPGVWRGEGTARVPGCAKQCFQPVKKLSSFS